MKEQQDAIEAYHKDLDYLITESPLPACFVDTAFDKMVLPQLLIDNDKKDAEKVVSCCASHIFIHVILFLFR